jgi:hypothetical protein
MLMMPTFYIKNIPRDLKKRLNRLKEDLNCPTWVDFLLEVVERVENQLSEQKEKKKVGCEGCWYFGGLRTGDRLCNKTGELLDYITYKNGCKERTEEPSIIPNNFDSLQPLAERLDVSVEELRKYINKEKES